MQEPQECSCRDRAGPQWSLVAEAGTLLYQFQLQARCSDTDLAQEMPKSAEEWHSTYSLLFFLLCFAEQLAPSPFS